MDRHHRRQSNESAKTIAITEVAPIAYCIFIFPKAVATIPTI
jgi:hypothetical protein